MTKFNYNKDSNCRLIVSAW